VTTEVDEAFICDEVFARVMDELWAGGWRHFGSYFFRYSHQLADNALQTITPLRIQLSAWELTKSQRRVLRRNADLRWEVVPAQVDEELCGMFQRHKARFTANVPDTLETFLGNDVTQGPCECRMLRVLDGGRLVAVSFFGLGLRAASSVYGIFEPDESRRSLGIFTMLLELDYCQAAGLEFLYPGYATREPSAYDYKKQFKGTEWMDFGSGDWQWLTKSDFNN